MTEFFEEDETAEDVLAAFKDSRERGVTQRPVTDLSSEQRAIIEEAMSLHCTELVDEYRLSDCLHCGWPWERGKGCPTVAKLSALLAPMEPTVVVTDEMVVDLARTLFLVEGANPRDLAPAWRPHAERLARSPLCPAAWQPEDYRYKELRDAAASLLAHPGDTGWYFNRLRAAVEALDVLDVAKQAIKRGPHESIYSKLDPRK